MIKPIWTLKELIELKSEKMVSDDEYNSSHPFVSKILMVPHLDETRGSRDEDLTLYGGSLTNCDKMMFKHKVSMHSIIVEGRWDCFDEKQEKLYEKNCVGVDMICIYSKDTPVIFLLGNKEDRSNPIMYILDEKKYYRIRHIVASMVETWNEKKLAIDDYYKNINDEIAMSDLFEYAIEDYVGLDMGLLIRDNKLQLTPMGDDDNFSDFKISYKDICKLQYQSVLYNRIPFHLAESMSALFYKVYPISNTYVNKPSKKTSEFEQFGESGFYVDGYNVYQYIHCMDAECSDPKEDYLYVIKTAKDDPIVMVSSGKEWYDIMIFDKDKFMSLWVELVYKAGKYKLVPDDILVKDPSQISIDLSKYLPLEKLDLVDNQIINTIVPE